MEKKVLLFDFDGTLVESGLGLVNSLRYALKEMGIDEPDDQKLERFIGPPLNVGFERWYGLNQEQIEKALPLFRLRYKEKGIYEANVYPGIKELLIYAKEKGCTCIIASAKPLYFIDKMVDFFDIRHYFDDIVGPGLDDELVNKAGMDTKEVVIGQILDKLESVKPASIVMIGDKASDIRAGQAYGLHTVGVCYGYGSKEELEHAKPDAIVETVEELENTLLGRHWL
jgi:phosphoglycolate phosphatase